MRNNRFFAMALVTVLGTAASSGATLFSLNSDPPFSPGGAMGSACCGGGTPTTPQLPPPTTTATWNGPDVGWFFAPASTIFGVTSILTVFASIPSPNLNSGSPRLVVYTGFTPGTTCASQVGCTTLENATFTAVANVYSGPTFGAINLNSGTSYFIGFENVAGFGTNITNGAGATNETFWFHGVHNETFIQGPGSSAPILRFDGTVPEPGTATTLLSGSIVLLSLGLLRRRKNAKQVN